MMPSMWIDQVGKSLQEHSVLLGSQPPPLDFLQSEILQALGRSIGRVAYPVGSKLDNLPRPKLSSSAGWVKIYDREAQRFRTMAGTRAAQHTLLGGRIGEELTGMTYRPSTGVQEYRSHPYQFNWTDWDFSPRVDVVALQEPFKVRTITISDGPATAVGSSLQMVWHRTMRQLPQFSLIGGTAVADASSFFSFDDDRSFVSGDYSAATDRLSALASRAVYRGLTEHLALPEEVARRLETGLFESELDYSRTLEQFKTKIPPVLMDSIPLPPLTKQRNGQLMGNILSFPILCLVNLSGYLRLCYDTPDHPFHQVARAGVERGFYTLRELSQLPVLINGDDILFKATSAEYSHWRSIIGQLGLKLSMGKNYFSKRFFTLNSEVHLSSGQLTRPWWGGLLTDTLRMRNELKWELGVDVLTSDMRRVASAIQSSFLSSLPESLRSLGNSIFLQSYRPLLEPYKGLQWFLPIELGGMGLDPIGQEYEVTYAQKKLAIRCAMEGLPSSFAPEGSLTSAANERKLLSHLGGSIKSGEVVRFGSRRYVLDRSRPLSLVFEDGGYRAYYRAYPLVQDQVTSQSLFSRWLDYHVDGVRISSEDVQRKTTRALRWGCSISDRYLDRFSRLHLLPRHRCLSREEYIPVRW
jgi:hypothetical protein